MNHSYCCIITDSQSEPLANGILEIAQGSTVWRVRVLDGGIGQVLEHEFLQFIGMDEDLPPMSGQILSREDGDILRIKPLSELGENARKNLRVPVRFDSFLYPLSGSWRGRLPIVRDRVTCISTPGKDIDVLVTQAGIAVNPRREELRERLTQAGMQVLEITQLRALAEQITGTPAPLPPAGRVIAKVIGRDGTLLDTIGERKGEE